jgi:hypothetical protein
MSGRLLVEQLESLSVCINQFYKGDFEITYRCEKGLTPTLDIRAYVGRAVALVTIDANKMSDHKFFSDWLVRIGGDLDLAIRKAVSESRK